MSTSISATEIGLPDNAKLKLGTGEDLQIYHDSTHSYLSNGTGNLFVEIPDGQKFQVQHGSEAIINGYADGRVELYHDNSKKSETRSDGLGIEGDSTFQTGSRHKFIGGSSSNLELGTYSSNNSSRDVHMSITSAGKVGINTTSPVGKLTVDENNASEHFQLRNTTNTSNFVAFGVDTSFNLRVYTNGSNERMRITSDGKVGIGTTSPSNLFEVVKGGTNVSKFEQITNNQGTDHACIFLKHSAARSGSNGVDLLFLNSSGSEVGKIDHGQSTTQYRTSSDYRLKENDVKITDGITRIKQLRPIRFNFIAEPDKTVDGFFAHEAAVAVPEAVSGTKDEVDSDNNPIIQGIDQSKLVPLLVAALHEAIGRIEALEAA